MRVADGLVVLLFTRAVDRAGEFSRDIVAPGAGMPGTAEASLDDREAAARARSGAAFFTVDQRASRISPSLTVRRAAVLVDCGSSIGAMAGRLGAC